MMDKQQLLRKFRRALGAAFYAPYIDVEAPESPVRRPHEKMAHWSESLAEATPEAAQRDFQPYARGCLWSDSCAREGVCMLVWRRACAVNQAKNAVAEARDA